MIAVICDGCGKTHLQQGPNTGPVPTPPGWRQVSVEAHMQPTLVQHQCSTCFAAIEQTMREQRAARSASNPQVQQPGKPPELPSARSGTERPDRR